MEWGRRRGIGRRITVRTGRLRKDLIATHFVLEIKEVGRGYNSSRVREATATSLPVTSVTQDDQ